MLKGIIFSLFLVQIPLVHGICQCDRNANLCDFRCCCDDACSIADKETFGCVSDLVDDKLCINSGGIVVKSNLPMLTVNTTFPDILCIDKDNFPERNYYQDPPQISSFSEVNNWIQSQPKLGVLKSNIEPGDYKIANPLYTADVEKKLIGVLSLPEMNSNCVSKMETVKFLHSHKTQCRPFISDLATSCIGQSSMSSKQYFSKKMKLLRSPKDLWKIAIEKDVDPPQKQVNNFFHVMSAVEELPGGFDDLSNSGAFISINPIFICQDNKECSEQDLQYDSNRQICSNVVESVNYYISWNNSVVSEANAIIRYGGSIHSSAADDIIISFGINFIHGATFDLQDIDGFSDATFKRSQQDGYTKGDPVVVGSLSKVDSPPDSETKEQSGYIVMDRFKPFLYLPSSGPRGACDFKAALDTARTILFGQNVQTGCLLKVQATATNANLCQDLERKIGLLISPKQRPSHVAIVPNSQTNKVSEWLQIFENLDISASTSANRDQDRVACNSLITSVTYEFLFAKTGSLQNPTSRIVGVLRRFGEPQQVRLTCRFSGGSVCPSETQIPITIRVRWTDITKRATVQFKDPWVVYNTIEKDAFYPFFM